MNENNVMHVKLRYLTGMTIRADDQAAFLTQAMALLAEHASTVKYLLSFHDDGVIWGRRDGEEWRLSNESFDDVSPAFRPGTLQEARFFGPAAEMLVWRDAGSLRARLLLEDDQGEETTCFDGRQLLWGSAVRKQENGFTLLVEGQQGMYHAVPRQVNDEDLSIGLTTRHYVDYDDDQAYVRWNRLVGFTTGSGG